MWIVKTIFYSKRIALEGLIEATIIEGSINANKATIIKPTFSNKSQELNSMGT